MCGIFGHTNFIKDELNKSREALHTLTHRGPDQWSEWYNKKVYLGHRRLSILDLSENGIQPMIDNEYNVIVTVNGEIYNYLELKNELKKKYRFQSTSDSEVILYGYIEWGIKVLVEKIDGMFAFCIYDNKRHKIYLVRDRVGIKPLFYSTINNKIAWASELKAIESFFEKSSLKIDYTAIYDFLTYIYIPTPKTMYKNVFKLQPAHYIEIDLLSNRYRIEKYWELDPSEKKIPLIDAQHELNHLVKKSVKAQLMSDVPVGFFLSGGMDSSTVVSAASQFSNKINTYSIGFDVESHDETHYAQIIADFLGTNHQRQILNAKQTSTLFPKIRDWYDEPFADTSAFPTYLVSKFAKQDSTVVLTGDGGDEVFGGYKWYGEIEERQEKLRKNRGLNNYKKRMLRSISELLKHSELKIQDSIFVIEQHLKFFGGMLENDKTEYKSLFSIPKDYDSYWHLKKYYREELPLRTRLQYVDFHTYLNDDILTKVDRATMAVSLEARVPLLSKEIIEFSFSLPENIRYSNNQLKGLMKSTYKDILPEKIITRDKKGFSIPLHIWGDKLLKKDKTIQETILLMLFKEI